MRDDTLPEPIGAPAAVDGPYAFLNDPGAQSPTARLISGVMAAVATVALLANGLLTSPSRFSEQHEQDLSLLRPVVTALGLYGQFPTARGVEIRNLVFYTGAALLALLGGLRLILATRAPRLSYDDLLDLRRRAASPFFWWMLLLLVSVVSSYYAHAPDMCKGRVLIRLLETAWWWPLAILLACRDAWRVAVGLLSVLALTAVLALWYYIVRVAPQHAGARLQYPIGNELWMGACLLPGVFVALAVALSRPESRGLPAAASAKSALRLGAALLALVVIITALYLTKSRSALIGLAAGLLTLACFVCGKLGRRVVLLLAILAALGGSIYLHRHLQEGVGGIRSHSIRSRLIYEWPYALHLFFQKPVAGNGDGAYSMLAGRLERDEQLDDPAILRLDEWSWPGHAHNEVLELLSDVGLVGAISYIAVVVLIVYRALRFCDRCPSSQRSDRWLAIGLSSALVGSVVEQCGDPAIREPGLPPIFLTVLALVWCFARQAVPAGPATEGGRRFPVWQVRLAGLAVCLAAALLGWQGVQDWRAARARYEAGRLMDKRDYAKSIAQADFAAEHLLDPFQRALARMIAVWVRSLAFDDALNQPAPPPGPTAPPVAVPSADPMSISEDALSRLIALDHDVPRFLRLSRLGAELHMNRARDFGRRGDKDRERDSHVKLISALMQNQKDEPFLLDRTTALWKVRPDAGALERLGWLRGLMRAGEFGDGFVELFRTLPNYRDFSQSMNDLYAVAMQDAKRTFATWHDKLSPETLRAAALAQALAGNPEEAVTLAEQAQGLYANAGARLFVAHSAAVHEEVRYRMAADPFADPDANLQRLAQADALLGGTPDPSRPLPGPLGETRLILLVAAGRETDAALQIQTLAGDGPIAAGNKRAGANVEVASRCLANPRLAMRALPFARRAAESSPDSSGAQAILLHALLAVGQDEEALGAADRFIQSTKNRGDGVAFLRRLEAKYPASPIWDRLQAAYPDLRHAATQPATSPAE
jgi:O-antigen ligase/tetratricopeptide (TPR) repeat protein